MRVAVFLPNWIGDVVMATPVLRALRAHIGAEGRLVGVMRPYVAEVLAGNTWLDETVLYEKASWLPGASEREAVRRMRELQLDAVLLLTNSFRTAWMARRSGARRRLGLRGDGRGWLLTHGIAKPTSGETGMPLPAIDTYLQLAAAMECTELSPRLELATTAADEQLADAVWERHGLPAGREMVVLNSGGAYGVAKRWPAEHFAALARRIVAQRRMSVLVNCGPAEREVAREIVYRANDHRVVSLADERELPIGLTKACIRRSRMLVTTDSGPRYLGIAFGLPVVTLFGPTDPRLVETHYPRETCLALGLECQPCMERVCPLGHHRCMRELAVDAVHAAVETLMAAPAKESAA